MTVSEAGGRPSRAAVVARVGLDMGAQGRRVRAARNVAPDADPKDEKCRRIQGGEEKMTIEIGRSSYCSEDSIYLVVDGKSVLMDRATAKRLVEAVLSVGQYHGFVE